ncbi:MAG: transposase [Gammaproteobacteria bacterium]|nr:transposase [Gammaproteobacteria bacterium]MDH3372691.1 transposase [Gammaproteobacteria bacterium]MDH3408054.1 transposase [Gammaproteobacteria bacterium]MDH3552526.1 transposase [Gammaproteobacteria bacterium]
MTYSTRVGVDLAKNLIQISVVSGRGKAMTKEIDGLVKQHPVCKRLTAIEGIGPIGALSLYAVTGSGKAFTKSGEFSAYLGLTPRQYSSAGKTNIVGISKKVGNRRLRSILIQGARAYVSRMKQPRSLKDRWLKDPIERAGPNRAAVALANRNERLQTKADYTNASEL